jgi:hypothetical protein
VRVNRSAPPRDTGAPNIPAGRDLLGTVCFYLHFAVMIYIVVGWAVANRAALVLYATFLPAISVQWRSNRNNCLLNNVESFLRTGAWRSAANPEERAWLGTLARNAIGIEPSARQIEVFTYSVMVDFWGLDLWHLRGW